MHAMLDTEDISAKLPAGLCGADIGPLHNVLRLARTTQLRVLHSHDRLQSRKEHAFEIGRPNFEHVATKGDFTPPIFCNQHFSTVLLDFIYNIIISARKIPSVSSIS
jgi:hypothetical protein